MCLAVSFRIGSPPSVIGSAVPLDSRADAARTSAGWESTPASPRSTERSASRFNAWATLVSSTSHGITG